MVLESLFQRPIGLRLLVDNAAAVSIVSSVEQSQAMAHVKRAQRINIRWLQELLGYVDEEGFGTIEEVTSVNASARRPLAQGGSEIVLVPTTEQRADIFTKPLPPAKFVESKRLILVDNG